MNQTRFICMVCDVWCVDLCFAAMTAEVTKWVRRVPLASHVIMDRGLSME